MQNLVSAAVLLFTSDLPPSNYQKKKFIQPLTQMPNLIITLDDSP